MTHRHQLADTVVNGFSADPLQALQSESLITTGDPLSGIAAAGADNAAGKLTFNIDGLARAIAPLRDACHWAGE